jgi:hypothetical protein
MQSTICKLMMAGLLLAGAAPLATAQDNQGAQQQPGAKQDMKDAGSDTKDAAKKTGHAVKKGTKKAAHKTAEKTKEGADKVEDKTQPQ